MSGINNNCQAFKVNATSRKKSMFLICLSIIHVMYDAKAATKIELQIFKNYLFYKFLNYQYQQGQQLEK